MLLRNFVSHFEIAAQLLNQLTELGWIIVSFPVSISFHIRFSFIAILVKAKTQAKRMLQTQISAKRIGEGPARKGVACHLILNRRNSEDLRCAQGEEWRSHVARTQHKVLKKKPQLLSFYLFHSFTFFIFPYCLCPQLIPDNVKWPLFNVWTYKYTSFSKPEIPCPLVSAL